MSKMKSKIIFTVTLVFGSLILGSADAFQPDVDDGHLVHVRTEKHRVRREVRTVTFAVDGKDYHFNFEPTKRRVYSRDIPVWLVKSKPGSSPNYTYELVPNTDRALSDGHFYVDNAKKAVAYVHYDEKNRDIIYDGLFGENDDVHLIKSISETQKRKSQKLRRLGGNHVIHKTQTRNRHIHAEDQQQSRGPSDLLHVKLAKPLDVLYPKLLILVDNDLFKYHYNDIAATIKYVATFWNAVDQKYTELDSPDIQLSVTGIIIANDERAFNYVHMSRLNESEFGENSAHIPYMYEYMRMYFHHNFSKDVDFQNYDAAVLMTALNTGIITGQTILGKICGDWYNDIIVRDGGWFNGVHTATHELAHALGVEHDSYKQPGECQWRNDKGGVSVMSPLQDGGDYYYWSNCTKRYLREFATVKAAECLVNRRRTERYFDENNDW